MLTPDMLYKFTDILMPTVPRKTLRDALIVNGGERTKTGNNLCFRCSALPAQEMLSTTCFRSTFTYPLPHRDRYQAGGRHKNPEGGWRISWAGLALGPDSLLAAVMASTLSPALLALVVEKKSENVPVPFTKHPPQHFLELLQEEHSAGLFDPVAAAFAAMDPLNQGFVNEDFVQNLLAKSGELVTFCDGMAISH